jgi:hypothetical protein
VILKINMLDHHFNKFCQDTILWRYLKPASISHKLRKLKTIVERRSKGKLVLCEHRETSELFTVRRIMLNVANANLDDGVPASILRDINQMQTLQHSGVQNFVDA